MHFIKSSVLQVSLSVEESTLTDVVIFSLTSEWDSCMWVNNSEPIAMNKPYKSDDISCKNIFGVKKVQPSEVSK